MPAGDASGQGLIMDLELVDDDQIMHAIAMSLGETETRKVSGPEEPTREITLTESIDDFTDSALSQCLNLLDLMPDTVYRVCDLLVTITKRNGDEWRDNMLLQLMKEVRFRQLVSTIMSNNFLLLFLCTLKYACSHILYVVDWQSSRLFNRYHSEPISNCWYTISRMRRS